MVNLESSIANETIRWQTDRVHIKRIYDVPTVDGGIFEMCCDGPEGSHNTLGKLSFEDNV